MRSSMSGRGLAIIVAASLTATLAPAALLLSASPALADFEVTKSNVPAYPVRKVVATGATLDVPKDGAVTLLRTSDGRQFHIVGPYAGTVANYENRPRKPGETLIGNDRRLPEDPPLGGMRGIKP
ncbi:MAG: hypothetical protein NW205_13980 [Hyphomicrobiaceae bacterium]|nr:hypothetical protein [Hyphomicrobiaceae bacterium]